MMTLLLGFLLGGEDYYTHTRCYDFNTRQGKFQACGLDLRSNEEPVRNASGNLMSYYVVKSTFLKYSQRHRHIPEPLKPVYVHLMTEGQQELTS